MLDRLRLEKVKANTVVFRQGDTDDMSYYMILAGRVEVWAREANRSPLRKARPQPPGPSEARSSPGQAEGDSNPKSAGFSPAQSPQTKKKIFQLGLAPIEVESSSGRHSVCQARSSRASPAEGRPQNLASSVLSGSRKAFESPRQSAQKKSVFAREAQSQQLDSEEELSPIKVVSERKVGRQAHYGAFQFSPARPKPAVLRRAEPLRSRLALTVRAVHSVRAAAAVGLTGRRGLPGAARPASERAVPGAGAAVCLGAGAGFRRESAGAGERRSR